MVEKIFHFFFIYIHFLVTNFQQMVILEVKITVSTFYVQNLEKLDVNEKTIYEHFHYLYYIVITCMNIHIHLLNLS